MKHQHSLLLLAVLLLSSCSGPSAEQIPTSQLPSPALYALTVTDLPEVGVPWQQSYSQTSSDKGYKWTYQAYQAIQPAEAENQLDSVYAINNDVILYEVDMSREDLPAPPESLGSIQGVEWKPATQLHQVGDKSAVWKTTLGDLLTPVWWLEFYQDHAYVRLSMFGFPDQIAPTLIYDLADIVAARLPANLEELKQDASGGPVSPPAGSVTPSSVALPTASATP
jgi:hypothetical protein